MGGFIMLKKGIRRNFILNMIAIVLCLAVAISIIMYIIFINFYNTKIVDDNDKTTLFLFNTVKNFIDGAYNVSSEIVRNSDVLTMQRDKQTKVFADSVERNEYIELIYAQKTDGQQTGRSSGELGNRSSRWWFKDIMSNPRPFVSKSYYSVATKMPCTSIFMPMYDINGKIIGVLGFDIKLEYIQGLIEKFSDMDNESYSFIIDGDGNVVAHPESKYMEEVWNFKKLTRQIPKKNSAGESYVDENGDVITEEVSFSISDEYKNAVQSVLEGNIGNTIVNFDGVDYYASYAPIPMKGTSDSWAVISLKDKNIALSVAYKMVFYFILISFVVIVIAAFIISLIVKKITKPLEVMTDATKKMVERNFNRDIDFKADNEVAMLAECFDFFTKNINGVISDINYTLTEVSRGNMRVKPKFQYKGDFIAIKNSLSEISDFLRDIMSHINSSADKVFNGAENLFKASENLSQGSEEQSDSLKRLSETISEISEKIESTAKSTVIAQESVKSVYGHIDMCGERLKNIVDAMENIKNSSEGVNNIIRVINEISSQTNFLAINASVEASRADSFGKGFSVIAGDIKELSDRSALETKDSQMLLERVISAIEEGNKIISETENALSEVINETRDMSDVIQNIAAASNEEVQFVDVLNIDIERISKVAEDNSLASEESSLAAKELSEQAGELKKVVGKFIL